MEAGVPGYEVNAWSGVIAPAGLPRPILDKLNAAVNAAIVEPGDARSASRSSAARAAAARPRSSPSSSASDSAKWADVVKRSGAKID